MNSIKKNVSLCFLLVIVLISLSTDALAATSSETWSLGIFGGIVTANEADLNTLITRANSRVGGISTPQFGNAYEFGGFIQRRLNQSILVLGLRPSYFTDSVNGSGGSGPSGGTYSYSLSGFTIFPYLKAYLLESSGVKLYMQGGIGYGSLNGTIQEAGATVNFNGTEFGYFGGLGVDFCFGAKSQHCLMVEGNVRYLSIPRNVVSSSSGSFSSNSLSQYGNSTELEIDQHDLATTMSGVQGIFGYQYAL